MVVSVRSSPLASVDGGRRDRPKAVGQAYCAAPSQAVVGIREHTLPLQLVANDGTGAPTLTDMGASFAIATDGLLTLFIEAPPNGSSVWVRVVREVTGAVFEQEITTDLLGKK